MGRAFSLGMVLGASLLLNLVFGVVALSPETATKQRPQVIVKSQPCPATTCRLKITQKTTTMRGE
jgi:hypothetical protein